MEKRFIIVYVYLNNNMFINSFISDILTYDEMIDEYMSSFFEKNDIKKLREMTIKEIKNSIISWERENDNKVYEMDTETFNTRFHSPSLDNMVKHVIKHI